LHDRRISPSYGIEGVFEIINAVSRAGFQVHDLEAARFSRPGAHDHKTAQLPWAGWLPNWGYFD